MKVIRNLFVASRFFFVMGMFILLMTLSYAFSSLLPVVITGLVAFVAVFIADVVILFSRRVKVDVSRTTSPIFSLGDENEVVVDIANLSGLRLKAEVIDELPEQLQERNFGLRFALLPFASFRHAYYVRPVARGEYNFGNVHVFVSSALGLVRRRISHPLSKNVPVYPSLIQMKRYELKTMARSAVENGVKKVRRIGHSYEFEHIRDYQRGDDYRSINWKATGRRSQLMVNQYEDERSQQVYCVIDKSRVMHMPFGGLSLFDYAVNASLVISNIVLGKQDKAGLITFSDGPQAVIKAGRRKAQLRSILEALYRDKEDVVEANYESLYMTVRKVVGGRSLLFLYTNFESTYALQRVLPQLRKLNAQHLLVVVIFENTEVSSGLPESIEGLEDIYRQITAEQYTLTKVQIVHQLKQHGILTMLTKPEQLTVNSINKYLELKSRGMI